MENKEFNSIYLVSPDGVAPSWMVSVSASVDLPLHHKVQKFLFWHRLTRVVPEKGPTTRRNAVYNDHICNKPSIFVWQRFGFLCFDGVQNWGEDSPGFR